MKKGLIGFMVLVILSGMAMAEERFELSFNYQNFSLKTKRVEEINVFFQQAYISSKQVQIEGLKSKQSFDWAYLKADYAISKVHFYAIGGIGKSRTEFSNLTIAELVTWGVNKYRWDMALDDAEGKSGMGFLYGFGTTVDLYEKDGFEISLAVQSLFQEENDINVILFAENNPFYGYFSYGELSKKIEIQKSRTSELLAQITLRKNLEKFSFSISGFASKIKTKYNGESVEKYYYVDLLNPWMNNSWDYNQKFKFETENKNLFGGSARVGYQATENAEMFVELMAGAKSAIQGGIKINL